MQKQSFCLTDLMKSIFCVSVPASHKTPACRVAQNYLLLLIYTKKAISRRSHLFFLDNSHINFAELGSEKHFPVWHLYLLQVNSKGQSNGLQGGWSCLVRSPCVEGDFVPLGPEAPPRAPGFPAGLRETAGPALSGYAQAEQIQSR